MSSRVYLKEILILDAAVILLFYFFIPDIAVHTTTLIYLLILNLLFLNLIGQKRNRELDEIKLIINNIRRNLYDEAGEIKLTNNLRGLQEDIKQMFEKTKSDIENMRRLQRVRTEFLANVSHELRTPIFAIQGYLETLLNGALNDEEVNKSFLEKANHHTLNLNSLLNDLIDISMIESGEMRMSFRYFNIDEFLKAVVNEMKPMAAEKEIELVYIPARDKLQLLGDKSKIRQVLINLIQNAVKYTEKGSVRVSVEEEKNTGRIVVKDTGIGISEEDMNRIFERFYRVDKARSRDVGGTGLGLAIVKHIVEAHGSKIEVKSAPDEGAEFSFKLKK